MTLAQKLGSFDRDIKSKLKILSLEVDSAHTECSIKAIGNGYGLLRFLLMKNVSCEYDRWVVETQLCKLRDSKTAARAVRPVFSSLISSKFLKCSRGISLPGMIILLVVYSYLVLVASIYGVLVCSLYLLSSVYLALGVLL